MFTHISIGQREVKLAMAKDLKPYDGQFLDLLDIGDLVSWKIFGKRDKQYGFITKIYIDRLETYERQFARAVVRGTDGEETSFMLSELTLESSNKKDNSNE